LVRNNSCYVTKIDDYPLDLHDENLELLPGLLRFHGFDLARE
jgi:hypothetical protein